MTEVYRFSETEILLFALVLLRMAAFVVSWPVFGVENVSNWVKLLFSLMFTLVVFPTLHWRVEQTTGLESRLILLIIKETFVGLTLGFLSRFFFFAFRIAGEMLSQAMGLSSAQTFNPALGGQSTAVEQLYVTLASLFYLAVNGHHYLISGLASSYAWVPAAQMTLNTSQFVGVGHMVQEVVEMGLKFSAPVVISVLVINIVLGVIGRTVPQLNVLVTSFPINILVGFTLLVITLPLLIDQMDGFLSLSTLRVFEFVKSF